MTKSVDIIHQTVRLIRQGKHDAALRLCESEMASSDAKAGALRARAHVNADLGNLSLRREDLEVAYSLDPSHDGGIFLLAICCLEQSDFYRAAEMARNLSEREKEGAMLILTIAQMGMGEIENAKRTLATVSDSTQLWMGKLITKSSLRVELDAASR